MTIQPCVIIPVYDHGGPVRATVAGLRDYRLPIYLVDDGSDPATQQQLAALAAAEPLVRLLRLPRNEGKGAAVVHGLRQAWRDGFTHALQIDADGQHDARDVPRFIGVAHDHPEAVISGQPIYDSSIPKVRLYGRYLSHVWVWVETLSLAIKDSMCGFRLYPLARTVKLIDTHRLPTRMDFDTAMIVRLAWAGAPVISLPTRVTYPRGGVSHFDMLRDNLRICRTHLLLIAGMLWRLPMLLWRKVSLSRQPAATHWARLDERGGYLGLQIVFAFYRIFGRRALRALLYPIVGYFLVVHRQARVASKLYLRRLYEHAGPSPALPQPPGWRDTWRHLFAFGESTLDKVAAWLGDVDHSQVEFPNRAELDALIASGRGAVLIGAHLGNWEMSRALAHFGGYRTVNAVVYTEHARRFNRLLARTNDGFGVNLIPVSTIGPETAMLLQEKIDRGELLVIVGDRTPPGDNGRVARVSFLGREAPFAQGPFLLASLLACPVYLFFCLREDTRYRIYFERFCERVELPRRARANALYGYLQRYVQRLESYCMRAPYQWFNFYDFWAASPNESAAVSLTSSEPDLDHVKPGRA
jgi:predicted LPLAT superfamily acyltransferase/GT2 family glycosyltransferase